MNQAERKLAISTVAGVVFLLALLVLIRISLRPTAPSVPQELPANEFVKSVPRQPLLPDLPALDEQNTNTLTNVTENVTQTNAAVIYRQAFALFDALSKEEKGVLVDWRTNVDASVEAELCEKMRPICDLMHQAAAVTNCDWGIEPLNYDTPLRHLSPARAIARATIWNAAHCRPNDVPGASEDVLSTLRLGQSVSHSALVGSLVDIAIQGVAESYLAANISLFRGSDAQRLSALLSDPAYEEVPSQVIEQEAGVHERLIAKLASLPPDQFETFLADLIKDNKLEGVSQLDRAAVLAGLQQVADSQRTMARALASGSIDEYNASMEQNNDLQQTSLMAKAFLPAYDKYLDRVERGEVNRALVVAGLAVAEEGPNALPSHLDPATDQPFGYTETSDGFELQSGYKTNGIPLKMQFK